MDFQQMWTMQTPVATIHNIMDTNNNQSSLTGDTTTTTTADLTAPATEAQTKKTEILEHNCDVDENNNDNSNTTANNQNHNLNFDRTSKQDNRLSLDTIIIEEIFYLSHNEEEDDKNSAVCDVEEYVFGGADEIIDARSDFRTDRHSPHSKIDDRKEDFHFDHRSSAKSSKKSLAEMEKPKEEDIPSDCSVITSSSHGNENALNNVSTSQNGKHVEDEKATINTAIDSANNNTVENASYLSRCNSDRSLASFFTQAMYVSRNRFEIDTINSQLDPADTYSLVSESEFSIARESMESRARIDELEFREFERLRSDSMASTSSQHSSSSSDDGNAWKSTQWNKASQPNIFQVPDYR